MFYIYSKQGFFKNKFKEILLNSNSIFFCIVRIFKNKCEKLEHLEFFHYL